jgi:hypothetical protein
LTLVALGALAALAAAAVITPVAVSITLWPTALVGSAHVNADPAIRAWPIACQAAAIIITALLAFTVWSTGGGDALAVIAFLVL